MKERRLIKVKEALMINEIDSVEPSTECKILLKKYINGETTIEKNIELLKKIYLDKNSKKVDE